MIAVERGRRVIDANDTSAPTVEITSPVSESSVSYLTPVKGSIKVDAGSVLEIYTVDVAPADQVELNNLGAASPAYRVIGQGTTPITDGTLATGTLTAPGLSVT